MRYLCFAIISLLIIGLLTSPALSQSVDPLAGPPLTSAQPSDRQTQAIQAIQQATDPSAVIAAYARAASQEPSQPLLAAYVHRMVEFNLPETAYQQARMLVDANSNDAVAWAVLAFVAARQGQMAEALADTVQATMRQPDNRFVQHTAGQVLAWYDLRKPTVSTSLSASLEKIRKDLSAQPAFADAYADASDQLKQEVASQPQARSPATQPTQAATESPEYSNQPWPEPVYPYSSATPESYDNYTYGYPSYPQQASYPSLVYNAPYLAPDWYGWSAPYGSYWPYGLYGAYWPFFSPRVVNNNIFVANDFWRLKLFGRDLQFLRTGDRFHLIGFDHSLFRDRFNLRRATDGRLAFSGRHDTSRDVGTLTRRDQARIFAPGRQPARLTFGTSAARNALRPGTDITRSQERTPRTLSQAPRLRSPGNDTANRGNTSRINSGPFRSDPLRPQALAPQTGGLTRSVHRSAQADISRSLALQSPQIGVSRDALGGRAIAPSAGRTTIARPSLPAAGFAPAPTRTMQPSMAPPSQSTWQGNIGTGRAVRSAPPSPSYRSAPQQDISRSAPAFRGGAGRAGPQGGGGRSGGGGRR